MPRLHHSSKLATFFHLKPIHTSSATPSHSLSPPSHQNIAELIHNQKTPSQALHTFKWASTLPNFTHSQSTYRALAAKFCAFRRFDSVHHLLDEMPGSIGEPPDDSIFVTLIKGLGRARMVAEAVKVLDLVCKFGKTPTLKVFNTILDVLVKEDIDLARKFYRKEMMGSSGVKGDDYTFGILMKGLCFTNRIADAFKLLQVIKSTGSNPNAVVYNTLLSALCKMGKIGRARSLMNELEEPNDVTFNILISGYCKQDDLVQALVMLEKSFGSGFVPDIVTVTKLVEGLCNAGRVADATEVLNRAESKQGKVDVVAYNTLIMGLCRTGKVKVACGLLREMERKGCLPNVHTYNALISGLCESEMLDAALDLFNEMQTDGINANFATYDVLIRGLFSGGKREDGFKMLALMEGMKGGSRGCISPHNSVLYGFYKENLWEEALEFLLKMHTLFPRAVDRSLRVLSLCEQGAMEDATEVYNQMISEGGSPSAIVYDCLVHGLCEERRAREAVELMGEMVGKGFLPVASTFNSIISEFCRQGKDASALMFLEDVVGQGCTPDAQSYGPIIRNLCRKREFEKAVAALLEMAERGIAPDQLTWNSLLLCLCQKPIWSRANFLFQVSLIIET